MLKINVILLLKKGETFIIATYAEFVIIDRRTGVSYSPFKNNRDSFLEFS